MDCELRILLVEDNLADIRLFREAFEDLDVDPQLDVVRDGVETIDYLEANRDSLPDIVLLDLNIPKKNGLEVLNFIKNDIQLKSVPVVILSSSASKLDILKCYESYANSYIKKPLKYHQFVEVVKNIINY